MKYGDDDPDDHADDHDHNSDGSEFSCAPVPRRSIFHRYGSVILVVMHLYLGVCGTHGGSSGTHGGGGSDDDDDDDDDTSTNVK